MSFDWQTWNGRAVRFVEFNIRDGRAVREAMSKDGETGSYACLALACRYADDDGPVFASADEIFSLPYKLHQRLWRLAGEACRVNGLIEADAPSS